MYIVRERLPKELESRWVEGGGGGSSSADFLLRQLRLCSWLGFHLNGFNGRMEGHGKDNLGLRVTPKASLIVPDFTISTYGSS